MFLPHFHISTFYLGHVTSDMLPLTFLPLAYSIFIYEWHFTADNFTSNIFTAGIFTEILLINECCIIIILRICTCWDYILPYPCWQHGRRGGKRKGRAHDEESETSAEPVTMFEIVRHGKCALQVRAPSLSWTRFTNCAAFDTITADTNANTDITWLKLSIFGQIFRQREAFIKS